MNEKNLIEQQYSERIVGFKNLIGAYELETLEDKVKDSLLKASLMFRHFFPHRSHSESEGFVRDIYFHSKMATIDTQEQFAEYLILNTKVVDESKVLSRNPAIFSTFHYGSYKLVVGVLLKAGVKLVVLTSADLASAMSELVGFSNEVARKNNWDGQSILLDTSSPLMIRKLVSYVREGWSVLVYADGATGADGMTRNENNLIAVDILNTSLYVRKGIAVISKLTKAPIVPTFCTFSSLFSRTLTLDSPIVNTRENPIPEHQIMQRVYDTLQKRVIANPSSWEGFLFLLKFIKTVPIDSFVLEENKKDELFYVINHKAYTFVKLDSRFFAVRINDLKFIKLDKELFDLFSMNLALRYDNLLRVIDFQQLSVLLTMQLIVKNSMI